MAGMLGLEKCYCKYCYLPCHFKDDGIGILVWHQAGQGSPSCHTESAGVINNDQIGPSLFLELGRYSRSRTRSHNRFSCLDRPPQSSQYSLSWGGCLLRQFLYPIRWLLLLPLLSGIFAFGFLLFSALFFVLVDLMK